MTRGRRLMSGWTPVVGVALLALAVPGYGGRALARARGGDAPATATGTVSTVAGGVGGPGKGTQVALGSLWGQPCGVASGGGRVYVADVYTVRSVNEQSDWLTTPAGMGATSPPGNGGPAKSAAVGSCAAVADRSGNLVIADQLTSQVRVVAAATGTFYGQAMTAGHIYPIAGNGTAGFAGDGGPALSAELDKPTGVAVDGSGNVVIADASNQRVRVVATVTGRFYGQAMTAGDIYTVAGDGTAGFAGDGGPAVKAELDYTPRAFSVLADQGGLAVDGAGNLLIADPANNRVRVVAARTGSYYGRAMTAGDIYTVAGDGTAGFAGDGGPAVKAELNTPHGLAVDGAGNLVIADDANNRVRVVAARSGSFYGRSMTAGNIYTAAGDGTFGFAGNGGPATKAELAQPGGVTVDGTGNLVIADDLNDQVRVVAARTGSFYGRAMTAGDIYTVAGFVSGLGCFSGDGGPARRAELCNPRGVTVDAAGNVLIADSLNSRVRAVAAATGTFYGRAMTAGDIYTIAGGGSSRANGIPATRALTYDPEGLAVAATGNLAIDDAGAQQVRMVAAATGTFYGQAMIAGDIYTIAGTGGQGYTGDGGPAAKATLDQPEAVTIDGQGNLVIADTVNNRVRVVAAATGTFYGQRMAAGDIYTIAGGGGSLANGVPATSASLYFPEAVAIDHSGNLVIADTLNNEVRVVAAATSTFYGQPMTGGDIYTIAGIGHWGFSGDGGPATKAELCSPNGLAVDGAGNVTITDSCNSRIRVIAAATGTFYGQPVTAGDIYTIAGTGTSGFSGDGGPATSAEFGFSQPSQLAEDPAGNLVIADGASNRIREVTK